MERDEIIRIDVGEAWEMTDCCCSSTSILYIDCQLASQKSRKLTTEESGGEIDSRRIGDEDSPGFVGDNGRITLLTEGLAWNGARPLR